jgi:hypothetical protein
MREVNTSHRNTVAGVGRFEGFWSPSSWAPVYCAILLACATKMTPERVVRAGCRSSTPSRKPALTDRRLHPRRHRNRRRYRWRSDRQWTQRAAVVGETPNLCCASARCRGLKLVVAKENATLCWARSSNFHRSAWTDLKGIIIPVDAYQVEAAKLRFKPLYAQSGTMTPSSA